MVFTLEALHAQFGDSLLLHYGDGDAPKLMVIDGGPAGVYQDSLRPRLEELRGDGQLAIQLVMVSHIDRDHITGIIALTRELIEAKAAGDPLPYKVVKLWHNSFGDLVGGNSGALGSALGAAVGAGADIPAHLPLSEPAAAIVADVGQGITLRNNAKKLALQVNAPFKRLVTAPETGRKVLDMGDGLKFTVVGPNKQRLDALRAEWALTQEKMKKAKEAKDAETIAAAFVDKSVPNLSSIVVLAEAGGKTMLLTGDARGDDILAGLKTAKLLEGGKLHVDLLKLPHHGSDRNVATEFFRAVTADHYVISADGTHGNPDLPTLHMISEARGQARYTIHLTNKEKRLTNFFAREKQAGKKYKVVFRKPSALSVKVKLGD